MQVLDADGDTVLYHMCNDLADTAILVYHDGCDNEECYTLTDWQGSYPKMLADVPDFEWALAESVDF